MKNCKIEFVEKPFCRIGKEIIYPEEVRLVTEEARQLYVYELGWAKCCETGDQGKRTPGSKKIEVDNVAQKTA